MRVGLTKRNDRPGGVVRGSSGRARTVRRAFDGSRSAAGQVSGASIGEVVVSKLHSSRDGPVTPASTGRRMPMAAPVLPFPGAMSPCQPIQARV